ncbi:hypothetical protein [Desulfovibrio sp. Huiquan2017]|uniref:hypothetical protein n=1 Tax=Desulfovibrio sp. Huiquan2017 TaxID=2816861 RepID=UPI001A93679A|nr:hypothetical protein [Desulfovibrio sp. Huiquan2017]
MLAVEMVIQRRPPGPGAEYPQPVGVWTSFLGALDAVEGDEYVQPVEVEHAKKSVPFIADHEVG